jgi:hypothetical protein
MSSKLLIEAVKVGSLPLVMYLIKEGHKNDDAVRFAAKNNNLEMVKYLVEHGMKDSALLLYSIKVDNVEFLIAGITIDTDVDDIKKAYSKACLMNRAKTRAYLKKIISNCCKL